MKLPDFLPKLPLEFWGVLFKLFMIKFSRHLAVAIACIFISMCYPGKERMHEYRLMRYKQVEQIEKQFQKIVSLVSLEQSPSTNDLFRAKYQRDLEKSFSDSQRLFDDEVNNQQKLAKLLKDKGPLFSGTDNTFTDKIQLGFSVENRIYKLSFLNSLKTVNSQARVLNIEFDRNRAVLSARVPFSQDVAKTSKLVLIYLEARVRDISKVESIRRYQDVIMNMKVTSVDLEESYHYVVVKVDGVLNAVEKKGWLGITKWKNEAPLLPMPEKQKLKKHKNNKSSKRKKSKENKAANNSPATTASSTIKKTVNTAVNTSSTNLEEQWEEDDGDDGW